MNAPLEIPSGAANRTISMRRPTGVSTRRVVRTRDWNSSSVILSSKIRLVWVSSGDKGKDYFGARSALGQPFGEVSAPWMSSVVGDAFNGVAHFG